MAQGQKAILFDWGGVLAASTAWLPLIQELKEKNCIVGIATAGRSLGYSDQQHAISQGIDLVKDPIFLNANKHRAEFYKDAATKFNINIQDIALIDDGPSDYKTKVRRVEDNFYVQAANDAGAHGIHYMGEVGDDRIDEVRTELQKLNFI